MRLSVVTTLYRSAAFIEPFYERACRAAATIAQDFEIVFVNDGSPDDSLERAVALHERDPRVRVVDLARNFGHHKALLAGLEHADGDLIFLTDVDLEEPPEEMVRLYELLVAERADLAYGVRASREGSFTQRMGGRAYFAVYNAFSSQRIPNDMCTSRVMTRRYRDSLLLHREREVVFSGLSALTGYRQVALPIAKTRRAGARSYNLGRSVGLLIDSITTLSSKPLIWVFVLGIAISVLAGLAALFIVVRRLVFGSQEEGWASLIVSVWLVGGLILFCQGMIAIYIAKIFLEVKGRPRHITRHVYERAAPPAAGGAGGRASAPAGPPDPWAGPLAATPLRSNGEGALAHARTPRPVEADPPEVTR
jgi:putative glycosyltransferase